MIIENKLYSNFLDNNLKGYLLNNNIKKEKIYPINLKSDYKSDFEFEDNKKDTQIRQDNEGFNFKKVLAPFLFASAVSIGAIIGISCLLKGYSKDNLSQ